jgi:hypothetical protein
VVELVDTLCLNRSGHYVREGSNPFLPTRAIRMADGFRCGTYPPPPGFTRGLIRNNSSQGYQIKLCKWPCGGMVDTLDSKPSTERCVGSSPTEATLYADMVEW